MNGTTISVSNLRQNAAKVIAVLDMSDAKEADRAKKEPRTSLTTYIKKRWRSTNSL